MAGLRVGQAFGVLLLPGFGVSSSSPQVLGHPTSTCDAGVNRSYHLKKVVVACLKQYSLRRIPLKVRAISAKVIY